MREQLERAYSDIVSWLAEKTELIIVENLEENIAESNVSCAKMAIDEGLIYSDDQAIVLAWSYEIGLFKWYEEVKWEEIMDNLIEDILDELSKKGEQQNGES